MVFDNAGFEKGIKQSMSSLNSFSKTLNTAGNTNSFKNLGDSINGIKFDGITSSLSTLTSKFSAAGIAGMTVVSEVTKGIMNKAKQVYNYVDDLIIQGGIRRASNIEKAKFQLEGLGIKYKDLEKAIDYAVTNTAYGLDQAAQAASQLAASGLDYKEVIGVHKSDGQELTRMSMALRAVSGVAAQTQTDYSMVARYFQDVANAGKVTGATLTYMTQVLNLPVKQDLAEGLKAIADGTYEATEEVQKNVKKLGNLEKLTTEDVADFAKDGLIDFETFSTIMFNKYADHAVAANNTLEGVKSNIRAAFAKIGADFIQPIIANGSPLVKFLDEVRAEVNGIRKNIQPFSQELAKIVNTGILSLTDSLRKMDLVSKIQAGKSLAMDLNKVLIHLKATITSIVRPIKEAFGDVFNDDIKEANKNSLSLHTRLMNLKNLLDQFNLNGRSEKAEKLKNVFKGLFSVLNIGKNILNSLLQIVAKVVGHLTGFSGNLLDLGSSIGQTITKFNEFLERTGFFEKVVDKVSSVLIKIIDFIIDKGSKLFNLLKDIFSKIDFAKAKQAIVGFADAIKTKFSGATNILGTVKESLFGFAKGIPGAFKKSTKDLEGYAAKDSKILSALSSTFEKVKGIFTKQDTDKKGLFGTILDGLKKGFESVKNWATTNLPNLKETVLGKLKELKESLQKFFSPGDFRFIHNLFNTLFGAGLLTGLGVFIKNFFNSFKTIKDGLDAVKKNIKVSQDDIKAFKDGIKNFFPGLNKSVDKVADSLSKGFTKSFDEVRETLKAYQAQLKADVLKKIAVSIAILAGSVLVMSLIDPNRLTGVMVALTAMVTELVGAMQMLNKTNLFTSEFTSDPSTTMVKLAAAVLIFSVALKTLSKCDPVKLAAAVAALSLILWELVGVIKVLDTIDAGDISKGVSALIPLGVALLVIASAVKKLGKLPFDQLLKGVGAVAALMGLMVAFVGLTDKFTQFKSSAKDISKVCKAMIALSAAILIISAAVKILGGMQLQDLVEGVGAIAVLLLAIAGFVGLLGTFDTASLSKVGLGLVIFAAGIVILTKSVKDLGGMSLENLAAGLGALVVMLLAIFGFVALMETVKTSKILVAANALIVIGVGIKLIASAISKIATSGDIPTILASMGALIGVMAAFTLMANLSDPKKITSFGMALMMMGPMFKSIGKSIKEIAEVGDVKAILASMVAIAGVLGVVGVVAATVDSSKLMKTGMAMLMMAPGLRAISDSIATLSGIGIEQVLVSLAGIGGVLLEIGLFSELVDPGKMIKTGAGLLVMGLALKAIAGVLTSLGNMSLQQVGIALLAIAGAFLVFGAVAVILAPVVGVMIGLAAAMLILSAAFAVIGVAVLAVGTGFMLLANAIAIVAAYSEGTIASFMDNLSQFLPYIVQVIGQTITAILDTIVQNKIKILQTLITLLDALLDAIKKEFPKIMEVLGLLMDGILNYIVEYAPKLADAALAIITAILSVIAEHVPEIIQAGVDIILALLEGISSAGVQIYDAAFNTIITFINGITETINTRTPELVEAFKGLFKACFTAVLTIITGNNIEFLRKGKDLMVNLRSGIESIRESVLNFFSNLGRDAIAKIKEKYEDFKNAGKYIVEGLVNGIAAAKQAALDKLTELGNNMKEAFNSAVQIKSPSKVFYESGMYICLGLANGIKAYSSQAVNEVSTLANSVVDESTNMISSAVDILNDMDALNPVIAPTLDLSNVVSGAKQINSMFNSRAIGVSGNAQNGDNNEAVIGGTTFIQNNYSPKALSRIDIYRDTRNLFSQAKGALS